MIFFIFLILGLIGLGAGSYLNSWVWRYHEKRFSYPARSVCVYCGKTLPWYDNIPIFSFIWLRGRCRFCRQIIPASYLLVEIAGGLLAPVLGWYAMARPELGPLAIFKIFFFVFLLLTIFIYDAKYMEIPTGVVWLGAVFAFFINHSLGLSTYCLALGTVIGWSFFAVQYYFSRGRWIGGGDVRLGALMGILLGWPLIIPAIALSYVAGALVAIPLLILKKKTARSEIPFGTFLSLGTMAAMLWGNFLIRWYLGIVGW